MNGRTEIHPDAVLEALLAKGGRSNRRANLAKMHELCRKQYEASSRDFSLPAIGRMAETGGILKGRALYNAQSADYRVLIEAWAAYAGPPVPKPAKMLASHEYLMRIEDPAIRSIMQTIIAERDKLKAQINVLKANTQVTVDRRPLGATILAAPEMQPMAVLALSAQLTSSEREALQKSVSPDYLEERGLREGSHGEIVNLRGRTIFEVSFARAIRKVLGE
ncbi:gamma-mobile-trio protein GmtX [Pseudomonas syringae]|uniref:Predicted Zn-dependent protease or its inactivated homolog n=1 Tax=Pseudomonas syringae pv. actinidiae TaxID=103796 RepID=A0A2V0Q8S3_PSESF|nr:gamma-mobile-trio protein GmtX [Pseudomonas syringae]EPN13745.1 alpha/beta hydrolase fold protein [Pseudomonas syringae pv. actinidiae ICMP 19070]AQL37119.1 alpha/beta hydrolase [Pseudomonas syringae pv. actinidiae ICMP 9853]EGH65861.1 alpha/beta hydrolase fold protein [Pseudomonas syringae pv. actinidiae str. M302091]EPM52143.1 alpha/beta hydrolase fold protein [Pseudomonas syringae pv. actinidiae ICMP 19103]EPM87064.1 alpha/beta hydrolase fold protein [Pseudomonas syringae pv. actinidiae 